jgi:nucleoside phosphorylase/CheY-like chemotaxis protein
MNVLIIDDELRKRELLSEVVRSSHVRITNLDSVASAQSARKQIEVRSYDVVVLDLVLPANDKSSDRRPEIGYELLQELAESGAAKRIIGATAHSEAIAAFEGGFREHTEQLLHVTPDGNEWKESLRTLLVQVSATLERPLPFDVDVCFITALRPSEYKAVEKLPIEWGAEMVLARHTLYRRGTVEIAGRKRTVVLAHLRQMGMVPACHITQLLIAQFRPRAVVMTGICGGLSSDVELGDVIVAERSWDWQAGKWSGDMEFAAAPDSKEASRELVVAAKAVESHTLELMRDLVHLNSPGRPFKIIDGPMLSGSAVVATDVLHEMFAAQHRKAVALDMECYGVYYASHFAPEPKPAFVCIKAVSDLAGAAKKNEYQEYCSALSAAVALKSLEIYFAS